MQSGLPERPREEHEDREELQAADKHERRKNVELQTCERVVVPCGPNSSESRSQVRNGGDSCRKRFKRRQACAEKQHDADNYRKKPDEGVGKNGEDDGIRNLRTAVDRDWRDGVGVEKSCELVAQLPEELKFLKW